MFNLKLLQNIFFIIYLHLKTSLGLLLHPYQTMQLLFLKKTFIIFTFTPIFYYLTATFFWRFLLRSIVLYFFPATCSLMIFKTTIAFFAFYWQVSLLYLFFKFKFYLQERTS